MNQRVPLGLAHFTFLDLAPDALIRLAARHGYAFVGLRLYPVAPGGLAYALPPGSAAMREIQALMADTGIAVYDIESVVVDAAFDLETLRPVLDQAEALRARRLNISGKDPDDGRLRDNVARIAALTAEYGMGIDIECMKWRSIDSIGKCAALADASGSADSGVLVDTLHLCRCGPVDALRQVPPALIRSAQLCDAPATPPPTDEAMIAEARGGRLIPGEGGLPLAGILDLLPPETVFSVELPMTSDLGIEARAARIFERTQALLVGNTGKDPS